MAFFTIRAFVLRISVITRDVLCSEKRVYRKISVFRYGAEYGRDTLELSTIKFNTFPTAVNGDACGDGSHQNNDIFIFNHWLDILSEEHLSVVIHFWGNNINGLMAIVRKEALFC